MAIPDLKSALEKLLCVLHASNIIFHDLLRAELPAMQIFKIKSEYSLFLHAWFD